MNLQSWLRQIFNPVRQERRPERRRFRPCLEYLEDRNLLSVYLVTSLADSGAGTLNQAILNSNGNSGPNMIDFDIGTGGAQTIDLTSPLPTLAVAVTIDGTTQPGWISAPLITVNGSGITIDSNGLTTTADGCKIKGLVLENFQNDGIGLYSNTNVVTGNYIEGNANGVEIANAVTGNVIGGTTVRGRNVISGNSADGVLIQEDSTDNTVQGNYIGTDSTGANPGPAAQSDGVYIGGGASDNTVGGAATGAGNVISGNSNDGVFIDVTASGNQLLGNLIGTNAADSAALANAANGVEIVGPSNTVGGTTGGNIISGNGNDGVLLEGFAHGDTLLGNTIGANAAGTLELRNGNNGVEIQGSHNTVGGTAAGDQNAIPCNLNDGIDIEGEFNTIEANTIGTSSLPDANGIGVYIQGSTNTVGGVGAEAGNDISGNLADGVFIGIGDDYNYVWGNTISTNGDNGVDIQGSGNQVGGVGADARNTIWANHNDGVLIRPTGSANQLTGNQIGTSLTGNASTYANGNDGVQILGSHNLVGNPVDSADGNVIAFNKKDGVEVSGSYNAIYENTILGNGNLGIDLDGGTGNSNTLAPTLSLASYNPTSKTLTITGSLTDTPSTKFILEFFANAVPVAPLVAQGQLYLDNLVVTTLATGSATFTAVLTSSMLPAAFSSTTTPIITATATDPTGDTSPFSNGAVDPVISAPAFTSAKTAAFTVTTPGSFTVATSGFPAPTLTEKGALPKGLTFDAATGVLSGTPAAGTSGTYTLHFSARNGIGAAATQTFTLTIHKLVTRLAIPTQVSVAAPTSATPVGHHDQFEATFTLTESAASPLSGRLTIVGFANLPAGVKFVSSTSAAFPAGSKKLKLTVILANATKAPLAALLAGASPLVDEVIG